MNVLSDALRDLCLIHVLASAGLFILLALTRHQFNKTYAQCWWAAQCWPVFAYFFMWACVKGLWDWLHGR